MKRLSSGPANQTLALLIFMVAFAAPLYGQEVRPSQKAETPEASAEQPGDVVSQRNVNSSEEISSKPQVASAPTSTQQASSQASQSGQPYVFPTKRERFKKYVKSTFGPGSFAMSAVKAGLDQWEDRPVEWEQGASGYGKRYASDFGRNAIQQTFIYGLDSALGLDTGFKKSTSKGFFPRMKDALAENITSRTRSGKRVISVPRITGVYASRVIQAEAWYPERYSYKDGLRRGTRSLLTGFGLNLVREFVFNW